MRTGTKRHPGMLQYISSGRTDIRQRAQCVPERRRRRAFVAQPLDGVHAGEARSNNNDVEVQPCRAHRRLEHEYAYRPHMYMVSAFYVEFIHIKACAKSNVMHIHV